MQIEQNKEKNKDHILKKMKKKNNRYMKPKWFFWDWKNQLISD